ncbi:Mobile element protein [hydrothermal vent metagenome]|uniref:Mobile element protein n=1 Tax=hydrothermal vent metagenome TaxID=652676 RepID=A0A3B0SEA6_9ZZZZ
MHCGMISGVELRRCCRVKLVTGGGQPRIIGFVEAVLYRYRAGIPWRDLPARFGDFRVVHTRHMRWSKSGVWERLFKHLSQDSDNEYAMIDSTIVRAHQHAAGARGRSKKPNVLGGPRAD